MSALTAFHEHMIHCPQHAGGVPQVNSLLGVLEALDRIRAAGRGGGSGVGVEVHQAKMLRECLQARGCPPPAGFLITLCRMMGDMCDPHSLPCTLHQVMVWCVRQGLHLKSHTGRFASVPEWMRAVQKRREGGRALFLDDMLQVSLEGALVCLSGGRCFQGLHWRNTAFGGYSGIEGF